MRPTTLLFLNNDEFSGITADVGAVKGKNFKGVRVETCWRFSCGAAHLRYAHAARGRPRTGPAAQAAFAGRRPRRRWRHPSAGGGTALGGEPGLAVCPPKTEPASS